MCHDNNNRWLYTKKARNSAHTYNPHIFYLHTIFITIYFYDFRPHKFSAHLYMMPFNFTFFTKKTKSLYTINVYIKKDKVSLCSVSIKIKSKNCLSCPRRQMSASYLSMQHSCVV